MAGEGRIHGLDALRGGALLLGIVLHGLLCFVAGMPWIVRDTQKSVLAGVLTLWIHMFRMPLFMFLAGYFARMSVGRRGSVGFVKDRLKRIGLPFVVFAPLMLIAVVAVGMWAAARQGDTAPPAPPEGVPTILLVLSPGHLWFLWTLLQLYAVVLLVRLLVAGRGWAERFGVRLGDALSRPGGVVIPFLSYWAAIELAKKGIGGPMTLLPELPSSIAFLGAFLAGWFCWGTAEAMPRLRRQWPAYLLLALAATTVVVLRLGVRIDMEALIEPWWARLAYAAAVWLWCYALIGLSTRLFIYEHPVARYLADSSYWLYIVHLPLVLVMQVLVAELSWWWPLKAALIIGVPIVVLLVSYHLLVRSTWLGAWLNGRRYPFSWHLAPARPAPPVLK